MIPHPEVNPQAWLSEVFISQQGEAKYQGRPHLFIRFGGCPFRCRYCDQPEALETQERFRIETKPGSGSFVTCKNPVHPGKLWQILQRYRTEFPTLHAVSYTGGEPLLYTDFIREFTPFLKSAGLSVFLETAGIQAKQLGNILDGLDIISMDIKIPSSSGEPWRMQEHRAFLLEATGGNADCYVKIVVDECSTIDEMREVGRMLAETAPSVQVYLQEVWPVHHDDKRPGPDTMDALLTEMKMWMPKVFTSKQQHKIDQVL